MLLASHEGAPRFSVGVITATEIYFGLQHGLVRAAEDNGAIEELVITHID